MDLLSPGTTFPTLVYKLIGILAAIIPVLIAAALVLLFIGVVRYIRHRGESHERTMIMWSLIALFVILSVWGILRLACASLIGDSSCSAGGYSPSLNGPYNNFDPRGLY